MSHEARPESIARAKPALEAHYSHARLQHFDGGGAPLPKPPPRRLFERGGVGHAVRQVPRHARAQLIAPAKPALDHPGLGVPLRGLPGFCQSGRDLPSQTVPGGLRDRLKSP